MAANEQADSAAMTLPAQAQADEAAYIAFYLQNGIADAVAIDLSSSSPLIDVEVADPSGTITFGLMQAIVNQQGGEIDGIPLEVTTVADLDQD